MSVSGLPDGFWAINIKKIHKMKRVQSRLVYIYLKWVWTSSSVFAGVRGFHLKRRILNILSLKKEEGKNKRMETLQLFCRWPPLSRQLWYIYNKEPHRFWRKLKTKLCRKSEESVLCENTGHEVRSPVPMLCKHTTAFDGHTSATREHLSLLSCDSIWVWF